MRLRDFPRLKNQELSPRFHRSSTHARLNATRRQHVDNNTSDFLATLGLKRKKKNGERERGMKRLHEFLPFPLIVFNWKATRVRWLSRRTIWKVAQTVPFLAVLYPKISSSSSPTYSNMPAAAASWVVNCEWFFFPPDCYDSTGHHCPKC